MWNADGRSGAYQSQTPGRSQAEHYRRRYGIDPHIYDDPPSQYFHILLDVADNDPTRLEALRAQPMMTVLAARDRQIAAHRAQAAAHK